MLVTLEGFGSIWERKAAGPAAMRSYCCAYYNTTGVVVNGKLRYRWKIGGKIRFNSTAGFNPNYPSRALHQVFECEPLEPCRGGWKQMLFKQMLARPVRPDAYLFVVVAQQTGRIDIASPFWKAAGLQVVAFSQDHDQQEAMLLMPAYSWILGEAGTFFVEPCTRQPWLATLVSGGTV